MQVLAFFYMDPLYLIMMAPVILISIWAQIKVKSAFNRYSKEALDSGETGAQIAMKVLKYSGIVDVSVEETHGYLSDHYDPSARVLRLSPDVYHGATVSAAGVAAHEAGHAIQHAEAYAFLGLRSALVPLTRFGSSLPWLLIIGGIILQSMGQITVGPTVSYIGLSLFGVIFLFQMVTLPVEFDASRRAKVLLVDYQLVSENEAAGVCKVLNAAALTYVAAAIAAAVQLLYWAMRLGLLGGRR